jgi:Anti-sigma factor NepR
MNETNDTKRQTPEKNMTRATAPRSARRSRTALSPDVQNKIGHQLRTMYSDVVSEGVPDRFAELIKQLDQQTKNKEPK